MEYRSISIADAIREINRTYFLPAIQREFVWDTARIEKLFDSLMSDFPIGAFLFWKVDADKVADQWATYKFITNYDKENPHNEEATLAGVSRDVHLILDGQQRLTSLNIGLMGSYRSFYYRWRKTKLYLNLLRKPEPDPDDPEKLTYQFAFRESEATDFPETECWYRVGQVLNFRDPEDAKGAIGDLVGRYSDEQKDNARRLVGRLHTRVHTFKFVSFFEETTPEYDKVLDIFVRTNSGGVKLEYSDLLLSTATAKWRQLDARSEINQLTDELNEIGPGYDFGKDFVLKGSLYLTGDLPIQYKVQNFNRTNLERIEANWSEVKTYLRAAVRLIASFGFNKKNIVSQTAVLPIALYIGRIRRPRFPESSQREEVAAQAAIRTWFVQTLLRNAFGTASDGRLRAARDEIFALAEGQFSPFPAQALSNSLGVGYPVSQAELDTYLANSYQGRYTNLVLSLAYPGRDWKNSLVHEDHIFPKSEFTRRALRARGYDDSTIGRFEAKVNQIPNLELLTDAENLEKNAMPFEDWIRTRDSGFRARHTIPAIADLGFDNFESFFDARRDELRRKLEIALGGVQSEPTKVEVECS